MKQRISGRDKRNHPTKFRGLLEQMQNSDSLGQQTFKPCGLEQLPCGEEHRGCAEKATVGIVPKI